MLNKFTVEWVWCKRNKQTVNNYNYDGKAMMTKKSGYWMLSVDVYLRVS